MIRWFIDALMHWLVQSSTRWLIDSVNSLTYWCTDSLSRWFIGSLGRSITVHWVIGSLSPWTWTIGWFFLLHIVSSIHCIVENHWIIGSLLLWLPGSLNCSFVDSFARWLIDSLNHNSFVYSVSCAWILSCHCHLNNHLLIRWFTSQLQHFMVSASQKLSYRPCQGLIVFSIHAGSIPPIAARKGCQWRAGWPRSLHCREPLCVTGPVSFWPSFYCLLLCFGGLGVHVHRSILLVSSLSRSLQFILFFPTGWKWW